MSGKFIVIMDNLAYHIDCGGHDHKLQIYTDVELAKEEAQSAVKLNNGNTYQAAVVYDISGDEMIEVAGYGDGYED